MYISVYKSISLSVSFRVRIKLNLEGKTMNNIAIIKLEEKVQETDYVSPICLNLRVGC